jgi:uncharacterized membrane protein
MKDLDLSPGTSPQHSLGRHLRNGTERHAANRSLNGAAGRLSSLAGALDSGAVGDFLRGEWLGHAFHPMATDFPLGAWMSASLLDLVGGPDTRVAARKLVGAGLLMALPTAASGLVEWNRSDNGARRIGVIHAATNTTALSLYALSFAVRKRSMNRTGIVLGILGGVTATVGGYFGGHLSLERGVGVRGRGADA